MRNYPDTSCKHCGSLMRGVAPSKTKTFCNLECSSRHQANKTRGDWPEANCLTCGQLFRRKMGGTDRKDGRSAPSYCSNECRTTGYAKRPEFAERMHAALAIKRMSRKTVIAWNKAIHLQKKLAKKKPVVFGPPTPRKCEDCGAAHNRHKVCTACADLRRKADKQRQKAIVRAKETVKVKLVNPYAILTRDKWICQLCGTKTPRALRGTYEDNAPEVDHIITLAEGGDHVPENLQCACRRCNSMKGSRSLGQLRIL